jgi:quinol monooxygenase YgiN
MYVVMTRVKLRTGTSGQCAELFRQSNPDIVRREKDWLGARMIFDSETNIVTVLATWRNAESYKKLSTSAAFQETMQKFGQFFASSPEISTNDVLVDMVP